MSRRKVTRFSGAPTLVDGTHPPSVFSDFTSDERDQVPSACSRQSSVSTPVGSLRVDVGGLRELLLDSECDNAPPRLFRP